MNKWRIKGLPLWWTPMTWQDKVHLLPFCQIIFFSWQNGLMEKHTYQGQPLKKVAYFLIGKICWDSKVST